LLASLERETADAPQEEEPTASQLAQPAHRSTYLGAGARGPAFPWRAQAVYLKGDFMVSVLDFAKSVGFTPPVSGKALEDKYGVRSLVDAIVTHSIRDFHRRTGADYGPFGVPTGGLTPDPRGGYQQNYVLGNIRLQDVDGLPEGSKTLETEVRLAAVKCFGTQDSDGSDSTYAVISVATVDPNNSGSNQLVTTWRTRILDNVHAGDTIFKGEGIGQPFSGAFPGSGISIHVAIWDHESGNADDIRDKIQEVLQDAAQKGAAALGDAAAADDPSVSGGTMGKITEFEVGGVKPFRFLTLGISDAIAHAVADDLVGEHTYVIPAANLADFADQDKFNASVKTSPDLDFDVQFNWPPTLNDEFLFTDGHGSYKIYFMLKSRFLPPWPVEPRLR
jgi:hypothetical protein